MKSLRTIAASSLFGAAVLLVPATIAPLSFAQEQTPAQQAAPPETQTAPPETQTAPAQNQTNTMDQTYKGQDHDNIQTKTTEGKEPTQTQFTMEQLLTSTVHQAWLLSGKNEANFFEMVEQLADISARNRGVKLPDSAAAGQKMGEYIKREAKADTDQLLYAVVDKAVLNATTTGPHHAGSGSENAQHPVVGARTGVSPQ